MVLLIAMETLLPWQQRHMFVTSLFEGITEYARFFPKPAKNALKLSMICCLEPLYRLLLDFIVYEWRINDSNCK